MEAEDRLTNNLKLTLGKARELETALANGDMEKANRALAYVLAALETNIEWIRPDVPQQQDPRKPFIQRMLP